MKRLRACSSRDPVFKSWSLVLPIFVQIFLFNMLNFPLSAVFCAVNRFNGLHNHKAQNKVRVATHRKCPLAFSCHVHSFFKCVYLKFCLINPFVPLSDASGKLAISKPEIVDRVSEGPHLHFGDLLGPLPVTVPYVPSAPKTVTCQIGQIWRPWLIHITSELAAVED